MRTEAIIRVALYSDIPIKHVGDISQMRFAQSAITEWEIIDAEVIGKSEEEPA